MHEVNLQNLYDSDSDPLKLKLKRGVDGQAFETGVMDASFLCSLTVRQQARRDRHPSAADIADQSSPPSRRARSIFASISAAMPPLHLRRRGPIVGGTREP